MYGFIVMAANVSCVFMVENDFKSREPVMLLDLRKEVHSHSSTAKPPSSDH